MIPVPFEEAHSWWWPEHSVYWINSETTSASLLEFTEHNLSLAVWFLMGVLAPPYGTIVLSNILYR